MTPHESERCRTGLDPGRRENVVQRHTASRRKAAYMRRSRDRGCEGHRILRRVLVGGRHLGSCRTISFHGQVETATLAASSRGKGLTISRSATPIERPGRKDARRRSGFPREEGEATEMSEARSVAGAVGRKRPRSCHLARKRSETARGNRQSVSSYDPPKRARVS